MKYVFKELKVLGKKGKSCTAQINKDILETIFTSTSTFLVTFLRVVTWAPFSEETPLFISFLSSPTRGFLPSRMVFYGGKRAFTNPAGVAVHPFWFRLANLVGVPTRGESVCLVDYSAGVFLSRMCLPVDVHLVNR